MASWSKVVSKQQFQYFVRGVANTADFKEVSFLDTSEKR